MFQFLKKFLKKIKKEPIGSFLVVSCVVGKAFAKARAKGRLNIFYVKMPEVVHTAHSEKCFALASLLTVERRYRRCERDRMLPYADGRAIKDMRQKHRRHTKMAHKHYCDGIKEFAERLKAHSRYPNGTIYAEHIDNLVKEMVGDTQ